jgi:hypothetical protein
LILCCWVAFITAPAARVLPAFAAGFTGFFRSPFVRYTAFVGNPATITGYLPLVFRVHGCKTAVGGFTRLSVVLISQIFHKKVFKVFWNASVFSKSLFMMLAVV